jgi:uncharacterized protein (TIGR02594 family)
MASALPAKYAWLAKEPGPKMLKEALKLYGTLEAPGSPNNPMILAWAKEVKAAGYTQDSIPWCGLFIAVCAKRAGWDAAPKGNALWARNWASWGNAVKTPMLGDVLVFARGSAGHVAIYVGEDATHWHILGGNQKDQVNIVRRAKSPAPLGIRRAPWKTAQPSNVRKVQLSAAGTPKAGSEA